MLKKSVFALLLFVTCGCSRFLEVTPVGKTTIPTLFSNMDGIRAAMAGIYSQMYAYYSSDFYTYPELTGDLITVNSGKAAASAWEIYNFNASADDDAGMVGHIWTQVFAAMADVNNALFYLPGLEASFPENKLELERDRAEALFLRALCHFDLCRVYAQPYGYTPDASHIGVPILRQTPGPDDNPARKTVKEVYDFIIKDLLEAESLLDHESPKPAFYVGQRAVRALLCRVYLYKGDWDNCLKYAQLSINGMRLAQGDAYVDMYSNLSDPGAEMIFRLNGLEKSSSLLDFYNQIGTVQPVALPSNSLLALFEGQENDLRMTSLMEQHTGEDSPSYSSKKFDAVQTGSSSDKQYYNPIVLRLSEVYLNRAEAYLNKGDLNAATADIKAIIGRGLKVEPSTIVFPETDKAALHQALEHEREKELCLEGHRFFDIARWGQAVKRDEQSTATLKSLNYPDNRYVLPIPQKELDANPNMVGNPGVNN